MATTYTDNLNLQQPDLDDDALITVINNDMAIIDKAVNGVQDGLAIVANGNTHVAISTGQFVYVRNHTTLTEGLYVASSNIAANATLSTSNLTADSAGGLNALNSKIIFQDVIVTFDSNGYGTFASPSGYRPLYAIGDTYWCAILHDTNGLWQVTCHAKADYNVLINSTTSLIKIYFIRE